MPTTTAAPVRDPLSSFMKARGVGAIVHQTRLANVVSILQVGGLLANKPGDFVPTGVDTTGHLNPSQVFASVVSDAHNAVPLSEATRVRSWDKWALLVFDLAVMDQEDVRVSSKWLFGKSVDEFSASGSDRPKLAKVLGQIGSKRSDEALQNEVVFGHDVPATEIKEISVATPEHRAELLESLADAGLTKVNGTPVVNLIKVRGCLNF